MENPVYPLDVELGRIGELPGLDAEDSVPCLKIRISPWIDTCPRRLLTEQREAVQLKISHEGGMVALGDASKPWKSTGRE
jgi:hypothetical protein